jgi:hypothetical protein
LSAHGNRSLFFLPAILAFALAIAEIILIATCARNVWQGKWRSAISISIAVLIFLAIPFTGKQSFILLDMIRFHAFSEYYKTSVEHIQTIDNQPTAAFFDWGDTGILGSITLYVLIYDETDDIALKSIDKNTFFYKKNMPARYGSINDERCITSAFAIQGHFYSVTITC